MRDDYRYRSAFFTNAMENWSIFDKGNTCENGGAKFWATLYSIYSLTVTDDHCKARQMTKNNSHIFLFPVSHYFPATVNCWPIGRASADEMAHMCHIQSETETSHSDQSSSNCQCQRKQSLACPSPPPTASSTAV